MKKFFTLFCLLMMLLSGCSGSSDNGNDNNKSEVKLPTGYWVAMYQGNDRGEYVEELNFTEDFYGHPLEIFPWLCEDYGDIVYLDLNDEGTGTFYEMTRDPVKVTVTEDKIEFEDGSSVTYQMDGDKLWYEQIEYPDVYFVFEKTTEKVINKMKEGCYGTVDLEEAQIGDLVAFGKYDTAPGNDKVEWLKWRVIDKDGDKLFIVVDQLIDSVIVGFVRP